LKMIVNVFSNYSQARPEVSSPKVRGPGGFPTIVCGNGPWAAATVSEASPQTDEACGMADGTRRFHMQDVTPAEAGLQDSGIPLDSGFRRNDGRRLGGMLATQ